MDRRELYQNFLSEFPLEGLANLPLERYTNLNREDSFCYWLETKLQDLGSIWGSSSFKFGIYKYINKPKEDSKYTSDNAYAWYSKLGNDRNEVYSKVIGDVYHIALAASLGEFNNVDIEGSGLSDIVKWKIAFLYSNERLVPVYKKEMLVTLAKHYGMAEPEKATQANLNAFLIEKKGDRNIFEFYDELIEVYKTITPSKEGSDSDTATEEQELMERLISKLRTLKPFNGYAEQYKWDILDKTDGKDNLGIVRSLFNTNLVDSIGYNNLFKNLSTQKPQELSECLDALFDENVALDKRVKDFKTGVRKLYSGDMKRLADDERTAASLLACKYPDKYTFYQNTVYKIICDYFGYETQPTGKGYGHFIEIINHFAAAYGEQVQELFAEQVAKYNHKPLNLAIQTLFWCMKDFMKNELSGNTEAILKDENRERNYWWLVSSPKVWRISSIKPGEVQDYSLYTENGNQRRVFQNFLDAKPGDLVIGYEANPVKKITALAEISKSAEETGNASISIKKTRTLLEPVTYAQVRENPALSEMEFLKNRNGSLFKLTKDEYEALMDMILEQDPVTETDKAKKYTKSDFLSEVYMTEENYDRLTSLLKEKKNIILQGAPGVGKTYSAERLAYSLMGEKDTLRRTIVQFHQNYSYEDFVMGYKPNEDGGFDLKNGVFYKACIQAQNDPDRDYFFIIDEINRGNLSKIFGELLMLIENGYRGKEIRLAYNGKPFYVPENLYIIGMMNTADRSLAMIDYALRRRFSFFEMKPGFDTKEFKAYQDKLNDDTFNKVVDAIKALNITIEQDNSLGCGFCIGHSYFCEKTSVDKGWLRNVIDFDIAPMLREYWFDDKTKADAEIKKLEDIVK